jgi:hypothetical protein
MFNIEKIGKILRNELKKLWIGEKSRFKKS